MEEARARKLARRAGVVEDGGAIEAGELSALERLHPDVLEAVLQELGVTEAARVRRVSRAMRKAVDAVGAWALLRLEAKSAGQIESAAAWFRQTQQAERIETRPGMRIAAGGTLEMNVQLGDEQAERLRYYSAINAFASACSASGGGLGGVCVTGNVHYSFAANRNSELVLLVAAILELDPLGARGSSAQALKSVSVQLSRGDWSYMHVYSMPDPILQLLSRFNHLERLDLPYHLDSAAAALSAALPALRSACVATYNGKALAAFASHPALEELEVFAVQPEGPRDRPAVSGFKRFAAGPAARRLRRLRIVFGGTSDFNVAEPSSLGRLTPLEMLGLAIHPTGAAEEDDPSVHLADLQSLRELDLEITTADFAPADFRRLALALAALRARPALASRFSLRTGALCLPLPAGFVETLRAAGPALVGLDCLVPLEGTAAVLAACPRLRRLRLYHQRRCWTSKGDRGGWLEALDALAGLRELRWLDLDLSSSGPLAAAHLRGLARTVAALRSRSLVALRLSLWTADGPEAEVALAELTDAAGPALAWLKVGERVVREESGERR